MPKINLPLINADGRRLKTQPRCSLLSEVCIELVITTTHVEFVHGCREAKALRFEGRFQNMNVFVFQSVPDRYDLRHAIHPGKRDTWYATRYRNAMRPGDLVFFWMAGDEPFRGLYGWGRIASAPYIKTSWDSHGVDVSYEVNFAKPILATFLRTDPVLGDMLIFRAPQATNFLLSPEQATRLVKIVKDRGETAPTVTEVGS
jgi:hypothetical protein